LQAGWPLLLDGKPCGQGFPLVKANIDLSQNVLFLRMSAIKDIIIKRPCAMKWTEMVGDERIRFCGQCNKNVHNLSDMTDREVNTLLESDIGRLCVTARQKPDGSIATDNCPVALRPARNRIRSYAVSALVTLYSVTSSASGQGLVSAPVDPRYGQSNLVGQMADYGYDTAKHISWIVTAVAFFIAFIIPIPKRRLHNSRLVAIELVARISLPLLVYLIGNYYINNTGGLGGCPVGGIDIPGKNRSAKWRPIAAIKRIAAKLRSRYVQELG
jgi:hypothetical protein